MSEKISLKAEDIEIAIMQNYGVRQNIIVPNVSWGLLPYEADIVILTKSNCAIEIEIKISKADLKKDKEKKHNHDGNFRELYFAVPEELCEFALTEIPEKAGLIKITKAIIPNRIRATGTHIEYFATFMRKAKINKHYIKWTKDERLKLAELGCMRILGLKKKLLKQEQVLFDDRRQWV